MVILVGLAAIFSGLNISLMSLQVSDLTRKARLGNPDARRVLPLRKNAYLSLASILFANVAVVSASTLVLESAFNGLIAAVATTILMVIFGELLPQAVFVRSALRFCAFFSPMIYLVTILTYPLSKPLAILLNRIIGHHDGGLHTRAELGMLIAEHHRTTKSELDDDEVEIIQSALLMSEKQVGEIMRPIKDVYWLSNTTILNAETVDDIKKHSYSRIPVFDKELTRCYGVLLMKDMVDVDFDNNPQAITGFHLHKTETIGRRTALDTMLRKFFRILSHLVPIEKDGRIVGVLTVEDLLEEIIGHEIADETDHALARR